MNPRTPFLRQLALQAALESLEECAPDRLTKSCLEKMNREGLLQGFMAGNSKIFLLAIGKASLPMTRAVGETFGWERLKGLVVTKKLDSEIPPGTGLKVIEAGHPLPNANSLVAGETALREMRGLSPENPALFLVSGGASSLFESLVDGITLEDLRNLTQKLLCSGISIEEINAVRSALSRVKGGKLLREAGDRECLSLVLSAVVGDRPETVGSGPTVWNGGNETEKARRILKEAGLWEELPVSVKETLALDARNPSVGKPPSRDRTVLVGSNRTLCLSVAGKLRSRGLSVLDLGSSLTGEAKELGNRLARLAKDIQESGNPVSAPAAVVSGGEAVVTFESACSGVGGPNQEVALSFAIEAAGFSETVLLSMDTDGIDGCSDSAGGLVDGKTAERIERAGLNPRRELENHNASLALRASSDFVITGETMNNLNDLRILLVGMPNC